MKLLNLVGVVVVSVIIVAIKGIYTIINIDTTLNKYDNSEVENENK